MPGPLRLSAQNRVHQMPKFVEERHHIGVLHQSRIIRRHLAGKIADQRCLRHIRARARRSPPAPRKTTCPSPRADACRDRTAPPGCPLSKTSKTDTAGCHAVRRRLAELHLESCAAVSSTPASTCAYGKYGRTDCESKSNADAPELLVPVAAARNVDRLQLRLPAAAQTPAPARARASRPSRLASSSFARNVPHIRRRAHHLVGSRQVGPAAKPKHARQSPAASPADPAGSACWPDTRACCRPETSAPADPALDANVITGCMSG